MPRPRGAPAPAPARWREHLTRLGVGRSYPAWFRQQSVCHEMRGSNCGGGRRSRRLGALGHRLAHSEGDPKTDPFCWEMGAAPITPLPLQAVDAALALEAGETQFFGGIDFV